MPLERPVVFPLLPLLPNGECACGPSCYRPGKHPAVLWGQLKEGDPVPRPREGAGYGIKTGARPFGSGIVVVDLDGKEAQRKWVELGGHEGRTYAVKTGRSGGIQLYFQHPGFHVKNTQGEIWSNGKKKPFTQAIDTRGDGGYACGPDSPHVSGNVYEIIDDADPAPLPQWLLEWLKRQPAPSAVQVYDGDVEGPERERRLELYRKYLETAPPCIDGQGGDPQLFNVVQYGAYDLALPQDDVLEAIREIYDPRCDPPWDDALDERVAHKCHYAKTASTRARRVPLLEEEEAALYGTGFGRPAVRAPSETGRSAHETAIPPSPDGGTVPTALPEPALDPADCGFKIRWGGWANAPTPPKYLVHNLLVENKVAMLFADPGSIKSWTAIDLAVSVASGLPWLGELAVATGAPDGDGAPVLYVDFEDGEFEFHRRVHVLTHGTERPELAYTYSPGNLDAPEFWDKLVKLQQSRNFRFIVLDTLAGGTPGADENDRNAAIALQFAGRFTEHFKDSSKVTVLFLHHANRSGEIRGTSAFKANVDTLFKLETLKDENGVHQAKLTCTKSGQKKTLPVWLEFSDDGLRRMEAPGTGSGGDEKGVKTEKRTLDEIQDEVRLLIEQSGPIASKEKIAALLAARAATVRTVVKDLEAQGDIRKIPAGWVTDNEALRKARLAENVLAHPDWSRGKLLTQSCVSREFFEQCISDGLLVQRASGGEVDGYLWIEK